jgi:hypothetical protein
MGMVSLACMLKKGKRFSKPGFEPGRSSIDRLAA